MTNFFVSVLERITRALLYFSFFYTVLSFFIDSIPSYVLQVLSFISVKLAGIDSFDLTVELSEWNETLAMVNHFFPLQECWQMVIDGIPYILGVLFVRWLKSLIPGFSN